MSQPQASVWLGALSNVWPASSSPLATVALAAAPAVQLFQQLR